MADSQVLKKDIEHDVESKNGDLPTINTRETAVLPSGSVDPVYEAKAKVLNRAVRISIKGNPLSRSRKH